MGRDKHLSPEDRRLWQNVTQGVSPLGTPKRHKYVLPLRNPSVPRPPLPYAPLADTPPQLQKDKRSRRGKVAPERTIDLHDLTQDQALSVLSASLHAARRDGVRLILVITGKGSLTHGGVLRRALPQWLACKDLAPLIAGYSPAHIRHGGTGAWYVRLKRKR